MPGNFSVAYAFFFCAGLYLPGVAGILIPLVIMTVTDLVISKFHYPQFFTWANFILDQSPNYLAYIGIMALGRMTGRKKPWWLLVTGGIVGAMLFYLVTNTASWFILGYAKTFAGWLRAMTTGQPGFPQTWEFFRNTLMSGGLFTGLFVGAMKLTEAEAEEKEEAPDESEEESGEKAPAEAGEAEPASAKY